MDIIRNNIHITGLAGEEDLPPDFTGQLVYYSETDHIFIPENEPEVMHIVQARLKLDILSERRIANRYGSLIVFDGIKQIALSYTPVGENQKLHTTKLNMPYHAFIDLPKESKLSGPTKAYAMDVFFSLVNTRTLHCHSVYAVYAPMHDRSGGEDLKTKRKEPVVAQSQEEKDEENSFDRIVESYFQSWDKETLF